MKYLILLPDNTYLLKFGRYTIYTRNENEKTQCLKTEKELKRYIKLLQNTTIKNYQIIEVKENEKK